MSFESNPNQIQTSIGDMSYQIFDPDSSGDEVRYAEWSAQILDQDDNIMCVRTGAMIPNMLPEEIQTMIDLLNAWRERATEGLIP